MDKVSFIHFALVVICLILFVSKTTSLYFDGYPELEEETTESTLLNVNITDTDDSDEYRNTLVLDDNIPNYHVDDRKDVNVSDDIIELNVGGQRITTLRSTLTAVPNSKLAFLFAKDNKTQASKQKKIYFFDYNPVQFQYLLDQLRAIKRRPQTPAYELNIVPPTVDTRFNFSDMLFELGLNPDRLLSPIVGTHLNLNVSSLVGWKMCYRGKYNTPFDSKILTNTCKGKRLLVACRSVTDTKTLVVAGVGKREDIFHSCEPNTYCTPQMKDDIGFYYAQDHAWGFQGRTRNIVQTSHTGDLDDSGESQGSFLLYRCDSSDDYSAYRLCWSLRSNVGRGGGDRCGSSINLHNTKGWERLIYQTV